MLAVDYMFQSTHPHGVRQSISQMIRNKTMFQSTHPHGVRLYLLVCQMFFIIVSIHAPTRGATKNRGSFLLRSYCFNPRTHTGCDCCPCQSADCLSVSIHAPTRGATARGFAMPSGQMFQSTHPHGVRLGDDYVGLGGGQFQSTHPHGVRLSISTYKLPLRLCFNPRTHTGCDHKLKISSLLAHYIQLNAKFYYPNIK